MKIWVVGELLAKIIIIDYRNNLYFLGEPPVLERHFDQVKQEETKCMDPLNKASIFIRKTMVDSSFLRWAKNVKTRFILPSLKSSHAVREMSRRGNPGARRRLAGKKMLGFWVGFFSFSLLICDGELLIFRVSFVLWPPFIRISSSRCGGVCQAPRSLAIDGRSFTRGLLSRLPKLTARVAQFGSIWGQFRPFGPSAKLGTHLSGTEQALTSADQFKKLKNKMNWKSKRKPLILSFFQTATESQLVEITKKSSRRKYTKIAQIIT